MQNLKTTNEGYIEKIIYKEGVTVWPAVPTLSKKKHDNAWWAIKDCEGKMASTGWSNEISHLWPTDDNWWTWKLSELVLLTTSMRTRNSRSLDGQGLIWNDTSNDGNTYENEF